MTVIRLDAATLAAIQAAKGPVYFAGESGEPVLECLLHPIHMPDQISTGRHLSTPEIDQMIARVRAVAGCGPEATDEEMDSMLKDDR